MHDSDSEEDDKRDNVKLAPSIVAESSSHIAKEQSDSKHFDCCKPLLL